MMDRERREKERQEVFAATMRSYRSAVRDALALQERTLEFTRRLLEGSAEAFRTQAERNRATLDDLARQSRRQQETLEALAREYANAYMNLLQVPFSYYQEVMEAMTAPWTGSGSRAGAEPPLEGYDSMSVREVSEKLDELSIEETRQLRSYEVRNKNRQTLVARFDDRIEGGPT